jgi:hypothetical protein
LWALFNLYYSQLAIQTTSHPPNNIFGIKLAIMCSVKLNQPVKR